MTRSEYQELVEFLGPRFEAIDRRFDAIEGRLTRVEVLGEDYRHQIQVVAEGVVALQQTMTDEFKRVRSEMAAGFESQGVLVRSLGNRVGRLEA